MCCVFLYCVLLCRVVLSCLLVVLCCVLVVLCCVLLCCVLSRLVLSCLALSGLVWSGLISSRLAWSFLVSSYLVLFRLVWSSLSLVLSCPQMEEDAQVSSITNLPFDAIEGTIQRHNKAAQVGKKIR